MKNEILPIVFIGRNLCSNFIAHDYRAREREREREKKIKFDSIKNQNFVNKVFICFHFVHQVMLDDNWTFWITGSNIDRHFFR